MSMMISCSCGTKLKVDASAAGKVVACPKCQRKLKVPGGNPPSQPATPRPAAPTNAAQPNSETILSCSCGQKMKVSAAHAGKTIICPACKRQMSVPGGATTPVTPVQPVSVQPVQPMPAQPMSAQPLPAQPLPAQPMAAQPLPAQPMPAQPMGQPGLPPGGFPGGAMGAPQNPYATPGAMGGGMPAYRNTPGRRRKSGTTSANGVLVAMIGVCILVGGGVITSVGLAANHMLAIKAKSNARPTMDTSDFSGLDMQARMREMRERQQKWMEEQKNFRESAKTFRDTALYSFKIGRTVSLIGCIVATVGYGMSIASTGSLLGLAISATVTASIGILLDLILRVIPWFVEKDPPYDFFMMGFVGIMGVDTGRLIGTLGIEILLAAHIILFSIYAMIGMFAKKKTGAALPITAISCTGTYLVLLLVLTIMIENGSRSDGFLYTLMAFFWLANIALLTGMGFLIGSLAKLRS